MRRSDLTVAGIARDAGVHANSQPLQQGSHLPQLTGQVVFTQDVDVERCHGLRLDGTDHVVEQRFTGQLVAEVLGAHETRSVHGNDRGAKFLAGVFADSVDVVAN